MRRDHQLLHPCRARITALGRAFLACPRGWTGWYLFRRSDPMEYPPSLVFVVVLHVVCDTLSYSSTHQGIQQIHSRPSKANIDPCCNLTSVCERAGVLWRRATFRNSGKPGHIPAKPTTQIFEGAGEAWGARCAHSSPRAAPWRFPIFTTLACKHMVCMYSTTVCPLCIHLRQRVCRGAAAVGQQTGDDIRGSSPPESVLYAQSANLGPQPAGAARPGGLWRKEGFYVWTKLEPHGN